MAERATYEQTILQLISTPAPRLSSVVPAIPPALDDLVAAMLEHDLDKRVPDMRAVRDRLSGIYPELHGSSVKLRSLPPPSSGSLERYVVHESAGPLNATVPGTAAVIPLVHRRRRSSTLIVWVAGAAAILGVGLGLWRLPPLGSVRAGCASLGGCVSRRPRGQFRARRRRGAAGVRDPDGSAPAPDPGVASTPTAPTQSPTAGSPLPSPARKATAATSPSSKANPTGQVGAAGISSEF